MYTFKFFFMFEKIYYPNKIISLKCNDRRYIYFFFFWFNIDIRTHLIEYSLNTFFKRI